MSKSALKRYKLDEFAAQIAKKNPPIVVEAGDREFSIPHPATWSDSVLELSDDPLAVARLLLGDEYPAWVAAGGSAALLGQIVADAAGAEDMGESSAS